MLLPGSASKILALTVIQAVPPPFIVTPTHVRPINHLLHVMDIDILAHIMAAQSFTIGVMITAPLPTGKRQINVASKLVVAHGCQSGRHHTHLGETQQIVASLAWTLSP